jgi:hypothetical protein
MARINLYPAFPTGSRIGTPILTQTVPAIPPGSQPGSVLFKNTVPALPVGSSPGTPLDIMERAAAEMTSQLLQKAKLKTTSR